MKLRNPLGTILILAAMAGATASAHAQQMPAASAATGPSTSAPPSAGLLNDFLRRQNPEFEKWDFGGQVRARFEHKEYFAAPGQPGAVDFAAKGDPDNTYFLMREKLHAGYTPCPWFTILGEARDSSSQHDDRNPNLDSDAFDLYQGYVRLGDPAQFPLSLKVGRQELIYGDERFIGNADWNNIPRTFDAAKLRFENETFWVDGFVSRPVVPRANKLNVSNEHDTFSGIYSSTKRLLPKHEVQGYFLSRNTGTGSPTFIEKPLSPLPSPRDIYTIGGRIKSLPGQFHGWDYELEGAYQFGRFKSTAAGPSLEQDAFAAHMAGGYTWTEAFGAPRLGLEYNYASGDGDPADGKHETFDNLFPTNHKFYGYMDFVSLQNIHDLRFSSSIKPLRKLTLTGDVHGFWLANTHDFFYQVNGAPRTTGGYGLNPGAGDYVGTELDFVATYAFKPYAALQGGFGHFFVGDYSKDTFAGKGGTKDANWVFVQATLTF